MYTELVGNFEPSVKENLNVIDFNPSAVIRAQALGLMPANTVDKAVDVFGCSCCGSGCNCSASSTWGCSKAPSSSLPSQESLMTAALAA